MSHEDIKPFSMGNGNPFAGNIEVLSYVLETLTGDPEHEE